MKVLLILNDPPYGTERSYNGLRLAGALAQQEGQEVQVFLLDDGTPVHSFRTLLNELSTIVRNTCRRRDHDATEPTFDIDTTANAKQHQALDRINAIRL